LTWRNISEDLMHLRRISREILKPQCDHTNVYATEFTTKHVLRRTLYNTRNIITDIRQSSNYRGGRQKAAQFNTKQNVIMLKPKKQ